MMKHIFIMMGVLLFLVTSTAMAAEDKNTNKISEKIEVRMPQLSDVKLNKLMEYIGIPVPNGLFECLCGPGRVAGGGCKYAEGHDCWCGGPLGGGGYTGFIIDALERCIKSKTYEDNKTIVDKISVKIENDVNKEKCPKIPDEIGLQSVVKNVFEKACLPVPDDINNLNPDADKMNDITEILSRNYIRGQTKRDELMEIYNKLDKFDSICEAAIETKLSADSVKGKGFTGTLGSFIWTYYGTDIFDMAQKYPDAINNIENFENLQKTVEWFGKEKEYISFVNRIVNNEKLQLMAKGSGNIIKLLNYYDKYNNISKVYNEEKYIRQKNNDIKDAQAIFTKSRTWDLNKINRVIKANYTNEEKILNRIKGIEEDRDIALKKNQVDSVNDIRIEYIASHSPESDEAKEWAKVLVLRENKAKNIIRKAENKIQELLIMITSNTVKREILEKYRKPLIEKTCDEYIEERIRNCPSNIDSCQLLNHESINKLWEDTKEDIRQRKEALKKAIERRDDDEREDIRKKMINKNILGHEIQK